MAPVTEVNSPIAGGGDNCPSCGSPLAKDQRYCLVCGARRGDPRLPFMDAVVFMDAVKQPQPGGAGDGGNKAPPPQKRPLLSANASLVAGVATLVLAIGVGVLIGRSGDSGSTTASATPQIIRVGGGGEETETSAGTEASEGSSTGKSGKGKKKGTSKKAEAKSETGASGQTKAAEEVFKPSVPQAKPEAKIGEKCEQGTAGCSKNGKFEGNFFGE